MNSVRGTIAVDIETCKGCELCIEACPQESIDLSGSINKQGYHYAVLVKDNCTGCVNCALVCPDAVITVYRARKQNGKKEPVAVISNVRRDITLNIGDVPQGRIDI
ncbi:MAG TPA: ferredoxin family protein [Bacteroidota bacterium]|jgi:2-oxoglutarate ferredoxin oxidoreductase subunit delta|nr:ferredoxin family protein [Bacteroidota bacterium]